MISLTNLRKLTQDKCEVYKEASGLASFRKVGEEGDKTDNQHCLILPNLLQRRKGVNLKLQKVKIRNLR